MLNVINIENHYYFNFRNYKFNELFLFNDEFYREMNQYYFKYLHQSYPLKEMVGGHFYYSTIGPNLNDAKDDIKLDNEDMVLIRKRNYMSLYSFYGGNKGNSFIIGRVCCIN